MTIALVISTLILTTKVLRCDADLIIAAKKAAAIGGDLEHLYNHNHDLRRICITRRSCTWILTKTLIISVIAVDQFKDNPEDIYHVPEYEQATNYLDKAGIDKKMQFKL